jgi:hypothetical protein
MANASFGDAARDGLRTLVATIDQEISKLPHGGDGAHPTDGLRASWLDLTKLLALGPTPETRQCPVCGGTGMRAASRCSSCWAALAPLLPMTATDAPRIEA